MAVVVPNEVKKVVLLCGKQRRLFETCSTARLLRQKKPIDKGAAYNHT